MFERRYETASDCVWFSFDFWRGFWLLVEELISGFWLKNERFLELSFVNGLIG